MKALHTEHGRVLAPSELALNHDRSVYHLGLHPDQIADTIIVVGDQHRVPLISRHFSTIRHKVQSREFCTHSGDFNHLPITVLSTGIGVDNVDIVMNELDALVNIDLHSRTVKHGLKKLNIVRLGTCGALNDQIPTGSFVHSRYAIGLDSVLHFYDARYDDDETELANLFATHTGWSIPGLRPYAIRGSEALGSLFEDGYFQGITITATGFYGPQGRVLRLPVAMPGLNDAMSTFSYRGIPVANYEMESSSLFGLGAMMGHHCTTVCAVVANRLRNEFLADHHKAIDTLIDKVLNTLATH